MGLRILHIINRPTVTGGMELYALNLSKELARRGHTVHMAARPGTDLAAAAADAGIGVVPITRGGAIQPYNIYSIASALRRERYDIMHAHTGNDYWPPLLAKWATLSRRSRVFVTRHILSPPRGFSSRFYFQNVDTICVSRSVLEVMRSFAAPGSRLHLVYPGIDPAAFSPSMAKPSFRAGFAIPEGAFVVGTMHKWFSKNARIIEKALADHPDIYFIVAGELKGHELEELSRIDGGRRRAFAAGVIRNMADFYRSSDAFLFPSFDEAFGLVVVEALLMGLPCLVASTGGASEIFRDGDCGYLIDASRPDLFSTALGRIRADGALRDKMSHNAISAGRRFALSSMAAEMERLYLGALGK